MAMVLLLVLVAVFAACNRDLENNNASQGLEYILNSDGNGYTVKAIGTCKDTDLKIPSSHKSKPVTAIAEKAFLECNNLTSVAFPKSVTSIGDEAFSFCTRIESISVEKDNAKYHSAGNCLIETQSKTLVFGCKNSVVPTDGRVESIARQAFAFCTGLSDVVIPDGVTDIGDEAFRECIGLGSVTIPNSVTTIGHYAFENCYGLKNITFGGTMEQWNAISKAESWSKAVQSCTVTCTDGTLEI